MKKQWVISAAALVVLTAGCKHEQPADERPVDMSAEERALREQAVEEKAVDYLEKLRIVAENGDEDMAFQLFPEIEQWSASLTREEKKLVDSIEEVYHEKYPDMENKLDELW